jgi:hypothetical protein
MYSETPDLLYFDTSRAKPYLSDDQLKTLQEGTLHLLESRCQCGHGKSDRPHPTRPSS